MFVAFFIKRPIFAAVCSILIVLAGAICIPTLPIAQYPQVALPQVVVQSFYTGASSEVVESSVTTPLEQAINGVEGMKYITSVSSNDGSSQITVTFDPSRNIDLAAVDVQNRVSTAQARLPNEVKQTGVTVTKNSSAFVLAISLVAEHGEYDQKFLSNYADVYLKNAIKRVKGVGDVQIFGERKFAMRIWVDPNKLAERGLGAADVVNALAEQNIQVPAGQIGQQPAPLEKEFQISLLVEGRLVEESEFEDIILKANPDGTLVRVRDIGRAELGAEDYSTTLTFNGKTGVGLGVLQLPTANALDVRNRVADTIEELSKRFPPGLKYTIAFDTTKAVSSSLREVVYTLFEAIGLVIVVIFIFLQSGKSTLIPAITIPVSLVGTFAFVKLFGFSINTLTLFGLTLATGLVVDDAIVVIENIQRFIDDKGMSATEAAHAAMNEVSGAVIATSLVLMAVFAPVAFLPGTTGRIYQQFSLTIAFSVGLSMFNSLTLTPALSARLLKRTTEQKNILFRGFDRGLDAVRNAYLASLRWLLRWRTVTLAAYAALLGLGAWLYFQVPGGFLPEEDEGYFIIAVQGPSGTSLGHTDRVLEATDKYIHSLPEVENTFAVGGFSFGGNGPNRALMFVTLKPWEERLKKEQSLASLVGKVRGPLLGNPDAMVLSFAPPAIQGVGNFGGFQFELEDQSGGSIQDLSRATDAVIGEARKAPDLVGMFTSFTADDPQIYLRVNRERAKQLNVPLTDVFQTLQVYTGSEYVDDFTFANRSYRVYVQADQQFRGNPKDLTSFYVRSRGGVGRGDLSATGLPTNTGGGASAVLTGSMVSLDNLLETEPRVSAGLINHYNLFRSTELNGSPAPGLSSGEGLAAMERVAKANLPQGMGFEWTGIAKEQLEAGNTTLLIFVLALVLVLLVLAAQYESFSLPFIVLLAVPLGLTGALLGQLIRHQANDVFCQIGLVMLIGLSAKNAILIVEFASQLRERGHSIAEAALEAAKERLRPILMTSFAFILGVFPLVIASGSGAESRHSLGTTVFGGMLLSTVLNLFFVPLLYAMVEGARERVVHTEPHAQADHEEAQMREHTRQLTWGAAMLFGLAASTVAPTAFAQASTTPPAPAPAAELPKPLVIDDPMLAKPPDAPRVIRSWEEALTLVRQQSPTYVSSYQNVLRAEAQSRVALVQLLPNLSGQASYTHQFLTESFSLAGATFRSPAADVLGVGATLAVPIVNARGIYAQDTAKANETAAKLSFDDARRQIASSLVHLLLTTLAGERAAELNRVGLRAALERLELAKTKVQFRQGTALDVERAEQDAAAARSTLITGDESLRQTREALGVALGSAVPMSAPGDLSLDAFEKAVVQSCRLNADVESRADVAAAKQRVLVAERTVKDAWLQLAPSLSLQSQLAYTSEAVLAPSTTWFVEGVLNIPLYDGGLAAATARDARASAEQYRQTLASTRLDALVSITQAQRAVTVLSASRDVAKTQRDLARSIDQRTREGYLHGLGTSLDLVTSAQSLRQAEINLVLLDFELAEAKANAVLANAECSY